MAISTTYQSIAQMLPTKEEFFGKSYAFASTVASNLNKVAIPTITLLAISGFAGAEAGGLAYAACVTKCTLFCTPAAFPACIMGCLPFLFFPSP